MKLGIIGSRTFPQPEMVVQYVNHLPHATIVLSGGASNVDSIAIATAKARGLPTQVFLPNTAGCTKNFEFTKAYYARNQQIADACEELQAFTDKDTGGTWDTIRRVRKLGKPVHVTKPTIHTPRVRPPYVIGKGPFHLKRVNFGSAALHLRKYFDSVAWADLLNQKRDDPIAFGERLAPEFIAFLHTQAFGVIHAITQPPQSRRHQGRPHPMTTVCHAVTQALNIPTITCFDAWDKPHRGVCLTVAPLTVLPIAQEYRGKVVFVLDDISTTNTTLRTSCQALTTLGIHCHGIAYVRY